jgi:Domain of unknown function (DUF5666)
MRNDTLQRPAPAACRRLRRCLAVLIGLALAACGGGVDTGGTGAQQSYTSGSVSGFGSVIVNAIRFDDSSAVITDDDGNRRTRDDLRLGMSTEIESSAVETGSTGATATANSIRFASEILGPVQVVNTTDQTMVVLGQTVRVSAATVFDAGLSGGLQAVRVGSVVEVYARFNAADASYDARRIEPREAASAYRLRGIVANLDSNARTFTLAGQTISYASAAGAVPGDLANGRFVKLRLQTNQVAGAWVALALLNGNREPADGDEAHVSGLVSAFTSATVFSVDGLAVDASAAAFPDGTAGLALGTHVEVEGRIESGVLRAKEVKIENEDEGESFELHGTLSALNTAAKTFVLRGVTVSYGGDVEFRDGTAADLAEGRELEVRGTLSSSGTQLTATRISFE